MVGEGLVVLAVERAGRGEHDGGIQVGDDARDGAGRRDAGLGAAVTRLQGGQHVRHLRRRKRTFATSLPANGQKNAHLQHCSPPKQPRAAATHGSSLRPNTLVSDHNRTLCVGSSR